jgi:hypothetical protein
METLILFPAGRAGEYVIPESVTYIYPWAFSGNTGLTSVYCLTEPPCYDMGRCWLFGLESHPFKIFYIEGIPGWEDSAENVFPFDPDWLWGIYEIVESSQDSFVNTGDWIGWLYVTKSPWTWSYSAACWLYITEPVAAAGGGWIFIPDLVPEIPGLGLVMMEGTDWGYSQGLGKYLYVDPNGSGWVYLAG